MSSTYRVLCLSHEPALILEPEWSGGTGGTAMVAAEQAAANPSEENGLGAHTECDLLIGRYSYPLLEVGCPASNGHQSTPRGRTPAHYPYHPRGAEWVRIEWLRVLWLAMQVAKDSTDPYDLAVVGKVPGCWTATRLERLAPEFRLELPEVPF